MIEGIIQIVTEFLAKNGYHIILERFGCDTLYGIWTESRANISFGCMAEYLGDLQFSDDHIIHRMYYPMGAIDGANKYTIIYTDPQMFEKLLRLLHENAFTRESRESIIVGELFNKPHD